MRWLALLACLLASPALAGTLYIDTGGATTNSGTSDNNTAKVGGVAAAVTCSATTYTGSTPGCSLAGSPDLSSVIVTPGATQDAIYIGCATNASQKIFWITAVNDGSDLVQTVGTITGCTATSTTWNIGGRHVWTTGNIQGAPRAGDTVLINNSPAAQAGSYLAFANSGDSTTGFVTVKGKTGIRPVLNATSTNAVLNANNKTNLWIENLELDQDGATGSALDMSGSPNSVVYNVKISDAGSTSAITTNNSMWIIGNELTGGAGPGIAYSGTTPLYIFGNYIHDNTGDGIAITSTVPRSQISNNIIDTNAGHGIYLSGSVAAGSGQQLITGNTVYGNGNSGLEVADVDTGVQLTNNIFVNNGDAAGEYNVEWAAGTAELVSFHAWNNYWCTGLAANVCTSTAGNVSGLTVNAQVASSETITDPSMSNPASGNFTIANTSVAYGVGYPGQLVGATGQGYTSLGAQIPASAGAGGGGSGIIGGGM